MHKINEKSTIWVEKYRPQDVRDLLIPENFKSKLQKYVEMKEIPNLGLWSSSPGTGKTSTANAIIKSINAEALFVNASLDNGIDMLRTKIQNFASTESFDGLKKIVVLDECDNLSANSQFGFRSLIETFSNNCRFILTGNYKERIIEPLRDRIENYDFGMFSKDEIVKSILERLIFILKNEKIEFNPKDLVQIINSFYPSIRSMIINLQKFSKSGKLEIQNLDNKDRYAEILGLINKKDFLKMIELVNNLENPDNLFTYFYDNFEKFTSRQNLPRIIVTIGKYQSYSSNAKDKHLNIAAMCSELMAL